MPRALFRSLAVGLFLVALSGGIAPAVAAVGLTVTTPYPSVSVQPGATLTMTVTVSVRQPARVGLSVAGLPQGWRAQLTGGGNEIHAVYVRPGSPVDVTLTVDVPKAARGTRNLAVIGSAGGEQSRLALQLDVASSAGGSAALASDYPSLQGPADQDFKFNLTLSNDTPQQLTYGMQAQGPSGWTVSVQPSGEANAASVTVDAHGTQRLEVTATAPSDATAGQYPISVAVASGQYQATADLTAIVTGKVQMQFSTPDQRLNTTANAGSVSDLQVVVLNNGTTPLRNVTLSGSGPSEWKVTFEPATVDLVAPNDSATATAHITPSNSAVAGDYSVSLSARGEGADQSMDIRVTVETPPIWGLLGIGLIVATLAGMVWVFRRFGRR